MTGSASQMATTNPDVPRLLQGAVPTKRYAEPMRFNVYLPPSYQTEETRRYPVVYWLHGSGGFT
ncbi:MAG: hypothetical protein HKN36_12965, partial [Hellea sp.]|nr:hypothetical protein [Hellea sp.]